MTRQAAEGAPEERKDKPKLPKQAWRLDELEETGHGSRSYLYEEIASGRLRAVKRGRISIVLELERQRWLESLPAAKSTYRLRKVEPEQNQAA